MTAHEAIVMLEKLKHNMSVIGECSYCNVCSKSKAQCIEDGLCTLDSAIEKLKEKI